MSDKFKTGADEGPDLVQLLEERGKFVGINKQFTEYGGKMKPLCKEFNID